MRRYITLGRSLPFARSASPAESEDDGVGTVLRILRGDGEDAIFTLLDVVDALPGANFEVGAVQDFVPEREQVLLGEFGLLEFPVHGKFDGAGHYQLLARIFRHGAADLVAFEGDVFELVLNGAQGGGDAGWSGANDVDVVDVGLGTRRNVRREPIQDDVDAFASLIDGILDERQSAEFAHDEHVRHGGLIFWGK